MVANTEIGKVVTIKIFRDGKEKENGTTIISCLGLNMIGEGKKHDLTDINLHNITKCYYNPWMNKKLCFLSDKIQEMYFDLGGHQLWKSKGQIKYSTKHYIIKHMDKKLIYQKARHYNYLRLINFFFATHYYHFLKEYLLKVDP